MPEANIPGAKPDAPARWPLWAALAGGGVLTALAGFGGAVAALTSLLAQPAFALAVAQWRGRAIAGTPVDLRALAREAGWLALLWGAAFALTIAVVSWPLSALQQGGSLLAALGLSMVAGVVLLGLWRVWPLWHGLENEGGTLPRHWRELGELEPGAWRGLGVAAIIGAILATIVLLA
ncbi:MAG TPA: hypothetical protein VJ484_12940, partial [Lysobacter sp.]|nr:hypothetical protein [Lysobacter sp.]